MKGAASSRALMRRRVTAAARLSWTLEKRHQLASCSVGASVAPAQPKNGAAARTQGSQGRQGQVKTKEGKERWDAPHVARGRPMGVTCEVGSAPGSCEAFGWQPSHVFESYTHTPGRLDPVLRLLKISPDFSYDP